MNDGDKSVIEQFASGASGLRASAIEAHRRNIPAVGVRGNVHMRFMAEVDNPVPDLVLRARYREDLLKEAEAARMPGP